ncbi:MAG: hypothetical protein ACAH95_05165 [Fimbriimonas sp.]
MRKTLNLAAMVAAFGIAGSAVAQSTSQSDLYPYGITLRGGVAVPLDRNLTNVASALANIGVEYDLRTPLLKNGETYLTFDYFFKGFGGAGGGTVLPVMINQRMYTSETTYRSYFFFGVGFAFINVNGNGTALAARGGVGQELGPRTIAEIAAIISDRAGGARATAITFNIGYRF